MNSVEEIVRTPQLHLLEEAAAAHVAHEEHHLYWLDVGAGGNHVNGDDDAGVIAVAEGGEQVFRPGPGGLVGDLLREVVALIEDQPGDADDVVGVAVVLGEDDGLGHVAAAGKARADSNVRRRSWVRLA